MIIKFSIICSLLVVLPIVFGLIQALGRLRVKSFGQGGFQYFSRLLISLRRKPKNLSRDLFVERFKLHFEPETGRFGDKELRQIVFGIYWPQIQMGKSYKALWRKLNMGFSPTPSGNQRLNQNERLELSTYWNRNFERPKESQKSLIK